MGYFLTNGGTRDENRSDLTDTFDDEEDQSPILEQRQQFITERRPRRRMMSPSTNENDIDGEEEQLSPILEQPQQFITERRPRRRRRIMSSSTEGENAMDIENEHNDELQPDLEERPRLSSYDEEDSARRQLLFDDFDDDGEEEQYDYDDDDDDDDNDEEEQLPYDVYEKNHSFDDVEHEHDRTNDNLEIKGNVTKFQEYNDSKTYDGFTEDLLKFIKLYEGFIAGSASLAIAMDSMGMSRRWKPKDIDIYIPIPEKQLGELTIEDISLIDITNKFKTYFVHTKKQKFIMNSSYNQTNGEDCLHINNKRIKSSSYPGNCFIQTFSGDIDVQLIFVTYPKNQTPENNSVRESVLSKYDYSMLQSTFAEGKVKILSKNSKDAIVNRRLEMVENTEIKLQSCIASTIRGYKYYARNFTPDNYKQFCFEKRKQLYEAFLNTSKVAEFEAVYSTDGEFESDAAARHYLEHEFEFKGSRVLLQKVNEYTYIPQFEHDTLRKVFVNNVRYRDGALTELTTVEKLKCDYVTYADNMRRSLYTTQDTFKIPEPLKPLDDTLKEIYIVTYRGDANIIKSAIDLWMSPQTSIVSGLKEHVKTIALRRQILNTSRESRDQFLTFEPEDKLFSEHPRYDYLNKYPKLKNFVVTFDYYNFKYGSSNLNGKWNFKIGNDGSFTDTIDYGGMTKLYIEGLSDEFKAILKESPEGHSYNENDDSAYISIPFHKRLLVMMSLAVCNESPQAFKIDDQILNICFDTQDIEYLNIIAAGALVMPPPIADTSVLSNLKIICRFINENEQEKCSDVYVKENFDLDKFDFTFVSEMINHSNIISLLEFYYKKRDMKKNGGGDENEDCVTEINAPNTYNSAFLFLNLMIGKIVIKSKHNKLITVNTFIL